MLYVYNLRVVSFYGLLVLASSACTGRGEALPEQRTRLQTMASSSSYAEPNPPAQMESHAQVALTNERRFADETHDEAWASQREQDIQTAIAKVDGVQSVRAACKHTLCKIELRFTDAGAQSEFSERSRSGHDLFVGGVLTLLINDNAEHRATWWMSRPGYRFPGVGGAPKPIHATEP